MSHKLKMVSAAVALALGAAASNAADFDDMVSVRGFGTFGVMHSTEDQADVLGSVFQPDGAGYTRDWDMRSDTKLAGQVDVRFTEKLSFTVQALSQYQHDSTFAPQIEWANLKYAFNSDLSVRVGRIALPTFMISDSRMIGYANTFVRPPEEVYQVSSITSNAVLGRFARVVTRHSLGRFRWGARVFRREWTAARVRLSAIVTISATPKDDATWRSVL